jgi:hypothetical protein
MLLVDFVATNNFVAISSLIHLQLNFNSLLDFDCMKELFCSVSNYRMAHFLSKLGINFVFFLQDDYRFYFIGLIEVIQKRNFEFFFFLETNINDKKQICTVKEYVMWKKIYFRSLDRAANKIRSWWLPICYDVKRESGLRRCMRNEYSFFLIIM